MSHIFPLQSRYALSTVYEEIKKTEEITKKEDSQDDDVTLGEWMRYWLQEYKKLRIKETTYANYKQIIETHICRDEIGTVILTNLSTAMLQKFYDRKSREITFYGRPLSSRMVRYIATLIGGALEQAVREEKIQMNPNKMVILPRKERAEIQPLSENEVKRLLHSIEGTDLYMPILLEIYTGLRKGELLGLCWKDIDFEQRLIRVRNSLARVPLEGSEKKSELRLQTPKTRKSVRILPMTEKVVECLKEHKHQQDIRKQKNALIWQEKDLIFCKEDGDFLEPRDFLAHFQKALEQAGLRKCRFHDMRHPYVKPATKKFITFLRISGQPYSCP